MSTINGFLSGLGGLSYTITTQGAGLEDFTSSLGGLFPSSPGDEPSQETPGLGLRETRLMEDTSSEFARSDFVATQASTGFPIFFAFNSTGASSFTGRTETFGSLGDDTIEDTDSDSMIYALDGNDIVHGNGGDDFIFGHGGDDVLYGGDGQDLLDGGDGYDVLYGGGGLDIFVFRKGQGTTVLADFELGYDVLDLEGFTDLTFEALQQAGEQVGDDIWFTVGDDLLILQNADLATLTEPDLCAK